MKPESWDRVKELFATLRELPPAEQPQHLDTLCADDPNIRAEVERMLRHADSPEHNAPHLPNDPYNAAGPKRIGPFVVLEHLGSGASGMVYRARDSDTKTQLAVKVLRLAIDSERARRRIECEGEILARFDHPGIARIHQVGTTTTEFGTLPYIAMEFVEGDPIDTYATTNNLDDRARVVLMAKVCDAVAYAHHRGVIHRDLKPANILIDNTANPKLLDFGIAKRINDPLDPRDLDSLTTRAGDILGTPGYMSPEQAGGDAATADTRADVYALGVILYELLTRQRLSKFSDMPLLAALEAVESKDPPLVSTTHPHLKGPLEAIITKAMDRNPRRRYDTAAALADDLHRYLEGTEITAEPISTTYKCRRYIHRHRSVLSVAAAVVVLLGIAFAFQWRANTIAIEIQAQANAQNIINYDVLQYFIRITGAGDITQMKSEFLSLLELHPKSTLYPSTNQIAFDLIGGKMQAVFDPALAAKSYKIALDASHIMHDTNHQMSLRSLQVYAEALNMSGQAVVALPLFTAQKDSLDFDPDAIDDDTDLKIKQRLLRLAMTYGDTRAHLGEHAWAIAYLEQVLASQILLFPPSPDGKENTDITNTRDMIAAIKQDRDKHSIKPEG